MPTSVRIAHVANSLASSALSLFLSHTQERARASIHLAKAFAQQWGHSSASSSSRSTLASVVYIHSVEYDRWPRRDAYSRRRRLFRAVPLPPFTRSRALPKKKGQCFCFGAKASWKSFGVVKVTRITSRVVLRWNVSASDGICQCLLWLYHALS